MLEADSQSTAGTSSGQDSSRKSRLSKTRHHGAGDVVVTIRWPVGDGLRFMRNLEAALDRSSNILVVQISSVSGPFDELIDRLLQLRAVSEEVGKKVVIRGGSPEFRSRLSRLAKACKELEDPTDPVEEDELIHLAEGIPRPVSFAGAVKPTGASGTPVIADDEDATGLLPDAFHDTEASHWASDALDQVLSSEASDWQPKQPAREQPPKTKRTPKQKITRFVRLGGLIIGGLIIAIGCEYLYLFSDTQYSVKPVEKSYEERVDFEARNEELEAELSEVRQQLKELADENATLRRMLSSIKQAVGV